jgi:hypothetical protein
MILVLNMVLLLGEGILSILLIMICLTKEPKKYK